MAKEVKSMNIIFKQCEIIYDCLKIFFIGSVSFEINNIKRNYNKKSSTVMLSMKYTFSYIY